MSRDSGVSPVLQRARERLAQIRARAESRAVQATGADAEHVPSARDVMTEDVVAVAPDAPLRVLAELMRKHQIGAVPVVDHLGRILGLVTDRDIVVRAVAAHREMDQVSAGDIMSIGVECVRLDDPVTAVAEKMARHRVRRIPVVDSDERLVGIISRADLL